MADHTKIEWTDATWNPVTGCSVISPGCTNCYAMRLAGTRMKHHPTRQGLTTATKAGPVWNGQVRFNESSLLEPLRWRRPRMIFVGAHTDIFHETVPNAWLDRLFAVMALAPQHTFQLLTKRPERMRQYLNAHDTSKPGDKITFAAFEMNRSSRGYAGLGGSATWPLPNVWLGVSVEDQRRADERVPLLLDTPAAVRWVSAEPMLGPVNLERWLHRCHSDRDGDCDHPGCPQIRDNEPERSGRHCPIDTWDSADDGDRLLPLLNWVVGGMESGPNARPGHPDWARGLRDQCAAAGVPFLWKQNGEWAPLEADNGDWPIDTPSCIRLMPDGRRGPTGWPMQRVGKRAAGRHLDGVLHDAYPEARP